MTEHRALIARNIGLEYRRLKPTPLIEYGVAYPRENSSPAFASLLKTVEEVAPSPQADLRLIVSYFGVGQLTVTTSPTMLLIDSNERQSSEQNDVAMTPRSSPVGRRV